jgi:hypothetical protein
MIEILSFAGSAVLGAVFKFLKHKEEQKQRNHNREMALIDKTNLSRSQAEKRGLGGSRWEQLWRVPVRPIVTYILYRVYIPTVYCHDNTGKYGNLPTTKWVLGMAVEFG